MEDEEYLALGEFSTLSLKIVAGVFGFLILSSIISSIFEKQANYLGTIILLLIIFSAVFFPMLYSFKHKSLTVTDKRIRGTIGRKTVDLPLDSVSAVSIKNAVFGMTATLAFSTSSGVIKFRGLQNGNLVFSVAKDLINQRQSGFDSTVQEATNNQSNSNELSKIKELKDLLDIGAITQEEFDAKKKELLGL